MVGLCKEEREKYMKVLSEYPKLRKLLWKEKFEDLTSLTIQFKELDQSKLEELMKRIPKVKTSYNYWGERSMDMVKYYTINKYNKLLEIGTLEENFLTTFSTFKDPGAYWENKGKTLSDDYEENAEDMRIIIEVKEKISPGKVICHDANFVSTDHELKIIVYGNKKKLKANEEIPPERWEFDDFIIDLKKDLRKEYEKSREGIDITEESKGVINKKSIDELINNWGNGKRYDVLKLYVQQNGKIRTIKPLPAFCGMNREEILNIKEQREDIRKIMEEDSTIAAAYLLPTFYIESQMGCGVKKSAYSVTLKILKKNSK